MKKEIKVLAISGSLRQKSSNSALVNAIIALAPENMKFTIYGELGELPHFNPDLDVEEGPAPVEGLRTQLKDADGVLICTPEYGNGVPGVLKNALDWVVSSGEFMNKPTAVISASPSPMGGDKAHASLLLTLNMIHAEIVDGGTLMIPHITLKLNKEGVITNPETKQELQSVLKGLEQACYKNRTHSHNPPGI
ncbi:NADPH-dependent FMN reductase [Cohnella soli]|uniref:NADPH-dependent FMN reductase n=1 Tax=Cohnella soli TaxID=425005 RepID=A0ABW0HUD9_9BACL